MKEEYRRENGKHKEKTYSGNHTLSCVDPSDRSDDGISAHMDGYEFF